jgi:hypothetical protein
LLAIAHKRAARSVGSPLKDRQPAAGGFFAFLCRPDLQRIPASGKARQLATAALQRGADTM